MFLAYSFTTYASIKTQNFDRKISIFFLFQLLFLDPFKDMPQDRGPPTDIPPSYSLFSLSVSLLQATGHVALHDAKYIFKMDQLAIVVPIMYFSDIKGNSTP